MGIADLMKRVDARIDRSRIGDLLLVGSTGIKGHFFSQPREALGADGTVNAIAISFDCQYQAVIGTLSAGSLVEIEGHGRFRFLNELIPGGDDSGMTTLVLGAQK